jgi:lysine 2,3-aminomutase
MNSQKIHEQEYKPLALLKENVPNELWNDYKWHLANQINTVEILQQYVNLSDDELAFFNNPKHFSFAITPYVLSIMDVNNPKCPIRKQFIPTIQELIHHSRDIEDSLNEHEQMPVQGIVHRYPDRCLFLTTMFCSSYCRFCTRSFYVARDKLNLDNTYTEQLEYVRKHEEIVDVILSGGDFLLLPNERIEYLLSELKKIKHIRFLRIGTRVPIVLPQRVTPELVNIIKKYGPIWMNIHVNHPNEFTPDSKMAINLIADNGIVCSSQSVLLNGVNNCPNIMTELFMRCLENRVRPYYLFQCDIVPNAHHFLTNVMEGMNILEHLRGHHSGLAHVQFIVDAPGGLGKVNLAPNYFISASNKNYSFRNYEGKVFSYPVIHNEEHNDDNCKFCKGIDHKYDSVADILDGKKHETIADNY